MFPGLTRQVIFLPNMLDYLTWRGDLPFQVSPLCEVDDLVLSQLAYVCFGPFVPGPNLFPQYVTLGAAAERLLEYDPEGSRIHQTSYMWKNVRKLLEIAAQSRRYKDIRLSAYVDELSDDTQFAALCMGLSDTVSVIAFRGTDDSLAGWKEDLLMALPDPIPAQIRAKEYLQSLIPQLEGKIALTGHSKGGNLAVYAAATAPESVQQRIFRIASLDAPGFSNRLIHDDGYLHLQDKLHVLLPESAVVGRLLEHENNYQIVRSTALGALQHDAFSWQVQGPELIRAESLTAYSEYVHAVFSTWLDQLNDNQRREFLEAVFDMISTLEARKIDEAAAALITKLPQLIRKLSSVDKSSKEGMIRLVLSLGEAALKSLRHNIIAKEKELLYGDDSHHLD